MKMFVIIKRLPFLDASKNEIIHLKMKEGKEINLKSIYITYRHDNSRWESGVGVGGGGQKGSEMRIERDFGAMDIRCSVQIFIELYT